MVHGKMVYSPDNMAWTIEEELPYTENFENYMQTGAKQPDFWYELGEKVEVGKKAEQLTPQKGQHIYEYDRLGEVPISTWEVGWAKGRCIHSKNASYWHGMSFAATPCNNAYYSGWFGYCADCGKKVTKVLIYMSKDAAANLKSINTGLGYYYHCPVKNCGHLENQSDRLSHKCSGLSYNRYKVVYEKNVEHKGEVYGVTRDSMHMYNDETMYDGQAVSVNCYLSLNGYSRQNYIFDGWNTEPDGSGTTFTDGARIMNLSEYDYKKDREKGTVKLYAQWKESFSSLLIDPSGGTYLGEKGISTVKKGYGDTYVLQSKDIVPPKGYIVKYQMNGGSREDKKDIREEEALQIFTGWSTGEKFQGYLRCLNENSQNYEYVFEGDNESEDYIAAIYQKGSVVLPKLVRENYHFGGWYEDAEFTIPIGMGGQEYIPKENCTVYALWSELVLQSTENMTANDGKGAVDLFWQQKDRENKIYKLYKSGDGVDFEEIPLGLEKGEKEEREERQEKQKVYGGSNTPQVYCVPAEGFYIIQAYGAAGENFGNNQGGKGGMVSARFYFRKGDKLTLQVGGRNGYNGGGKGSAGGGGATTVSLNGDYLLVAGGGGGASAYDTGGIGGILTTADTNSMIGADSYEAGGGGAGFYSGAAGEVKKHSHIKDCLHTHEEEICYRLGNCGGEFIREVRHMGDARCDIDEFGNYLGYAVRCFDYIRGTHCVTVCNFPEVAGCGSAPGHCFFEYIYTCNRCGVTKKSMYQDFEEAPNRCDALSGKVLFCDKQEGYICGYTEGQVLSHTPSGGGNNFISEKALWSDQRAGVQEGDGYVIIVGEITGFTEARELKNVAAPDESAPDIIEKEAVKLVGLSEQRIKVMFEFPQDFGTKYYFRAKSFGPKTGQLLCVSNKTSNEIITGTEGIYYCVDENPHLIMTKEASQVPGDKIYRKTELEILLDTETKYLHMAAVDRAGNVGKTIDIRLERKKTDWPVSTGPVKISSCFAGGEYESVYEKKGKYYVRADGETPFLLSFSAYTGGEVTENYQINLLQFCIGYESLSGKQKLQTNENQIPFSDIYEAFLEKLPSEKIRSTMKGEQLLLEGNYAEVVRRNQCTENSIAKAFTVEASEHGKALFVYPGAAVVRKEKSVLSEESTDIKNGIILLPDGKGPDITGWDQIENADFKKQGNVEIVLQVYDEDSGLRDAVLEIINEDLHMSRAYKADEKGRLAFCLEEDDVLRKGAVSFRMVAKDYVGNETVVEHGKSDFGLWAQINRFLEPREGAFKKGESGILWAKTWGYADSLEVIFPEEFTETMSTTKKNFYYKETEHYENREEIVFTVPFWDCKEQYTVLVRACKNGEILEETPIIIVLEGESILDEIRTRLR